VTPRPPFHAHVRRRARRGEGGVVGRDGQAARGRARADEHGRERVAAQLAAVGGGDDRGQPRAQVAERDGAARDDDGGRGRARRDDGRRERALVARQRERRAVERLALLVPEKVAVL